MKHKTLLLVAGLLLGLAPFAVAQKSGTSKQAVRKQIVPQTKAPKVAVDSTGYIVRVGEKAPDFSITLTNGKQVSTKNLRGKVVLLQFTASWCGVCRKEMPFLEKDIWQKHKDKSDFVFIGIDRDEPKETVMRFAEQTGVTYPLGLDPGAKIFSLFAVPESGITRNVLIDRTGRIVFLTRLFNEEEFNSLVRKVGEELDRK